MKKNREILVAEIEGIIEQLARSHVSEAMIFEQAEILHDGLPFVKLLRPCRLEDGISTIKADDQALLLDLHERAASAGRLMKFVPASGAASRMFKDLLAVVRDFAQIDFATLTQSCLNNSSVKSFKTFFDNLQRFAFVAGIEEIAAENGIDLATEEVRRQWPRLLSLLLSPEGLNFASLPKGLIPFHRYPEGARTPIREHIAEALAYTLTREKRVRIHFTLSPEHLEIAEKHFSDLKKELPGFILDIETSLQKRTTETIAVTMENTAFKDASGQLTFRPGGHGALLENLNDLEGDLVFIKNIDNVKPDALKDETILYKKLISGLLIATQDNIFRFLQALDSGRYDEALLTEIEQFARQRLSAGLTEDFAVRTLSERASELFSLLNRPLRVCGMVRNQGEPGGGPFWIVDQYGKISIQIVESAQVDRSDSQQKQILESSTHFNPVDLVCAVRDFRGKCFDLTAYSNKYMGFVTIKSKDGTEVKAYELPGLWNGAMAHWNTIFVEVPSTTFAPVKTVNDLLRPEHQNCGCL